MFGCFTQGDYIELMLGSFMVISTMAAAALGNTMGDVLGLCCAGTVESLATKIGVKAPQLSPIQLNMKSSRLVSNVVSWKLMLLMLSQVLSVDVLCETE